MKKWRERGGGRREGGGHGGGVKELRMSAHFSSKIISSAGRLRRMRRGAEERNDLRTFPEG